MKKPHLLLMQVPVFLLILCCLPLTAQSMSIRDQGEIFGTGGALELGTDEWAQSITAGISGLLTQIEIQFHYGVPTEPPALNLSIFGGGNPISGSALFTEQRFITDADLDKDLANINVFAWDLRSAGLFFDAGDVFTFALVAEGVGYNIAGNEGGYDRGELFRNGVELQELSDIAFITYVKPIPVTPALWLFGSGMLGLIGIARRKAA